MTLERARFFESAEHGVVLSLDDPEEADQFDDYLSEHCQAKYLVRFEGDTMAFVFGNAYALADVRDLYARFLRWGQASEGR